MPLPITASNAARAEAYGRHRAGCFAAIERFEARRRAQAEEEVGDAVARLDRDQRTFARGAREMRAVVESRAEIKPPACRFDESFVRLHIVNFGVANG